MQHLYTGQESSHLHAPTDLCTHGWTHISHFLHMFRALVRMHKNLNKLLVLLSTELPKPRHTVRHTYTHMPLFAHILTFGWVNTYLCLWACRDFKNFLHQNELPISISMNFLRSPHTHFQIQPCGIHGHLCIHKQINTHIEVRPMVLCALWSRGSYRDVLYLRSANCPSAAAWPTWHSVKFRDATRGTTVIWAL